MTAFAAAVRAAAPWVLFAGAPSPAALARAEAWARPSLADVPAELFEPESLPEFVLPAVACVRALLDGERLGSAQLDAVARSDASAAVWLQAWRPRS